MADYMYSAFISYRHIEPDQTIARRIERSIELFPIPSVYRKDPKKKHFNNVFRDTDELSLDRDLTTGIDYALSQSEFLIVILSPQYKESPWCLIPSTAIGRIVPRACRARVSDRPWTYLRRGARLWTR